MVAVYLQFSQDNSVNEAAHAHLIKIQGLYCFLEWIVQAKFSHSLSTPHFYDVIHRVSSRPAYIHILSALIYTIFATMTLPVMKQPLCCVYSTYEFTLHR